MIKIKPMEKEPLAFLMQKGGGRVMWIYNPLEFFELKNQDGNNLNLWKLLK